MSRSIWELDFKDAITGGLSKVTSSVQNLFAKIALGEKQAESRLNSLGNKFGWLKGAIAAVGIGFGIAELVQFGKSSVESFDAAATAAANVRSVIAATGGAVGRTAEELIKQAEALQRVTLFGDDATLAMDSVLLTFKNIRGEVFDRTVPAIQDIATIMKTDLSSAAMQVGKALNDPANGLSMLSRTGITFSESQQRVIKELQATGHLADAQGIILKELESKFGGAAQAAALAGAGPFEQFMNVLDDLKEKIGENLVDAFSNLLPLMYGAVDIVSRSIDFYNAHAEVINTLATIVAFAAAGWGVYNLVTYGAAAATAVLNAVMAMNPIGLIAIAIGAAIGVVVMLWKKFEGFRAFLYGLWGSIKEIFKAIADIFAKVFGGMANVLEGIFTGNWDLAKKGMTDFLQGIVAGNPVGFAVSYGKNIAQGFVNGYQDGVEDFRNGKKKAPKPGLAGKYSTALPTGGAPSLAGAGSASGITSGGSAKMVNVRIDSLIKNFTIETTNMPQSITQVKEMVKEALVGAIHDTELAIG